MPKKEFNLRGGFKLPQLTKMKSLFHPHLWMPVLFGLSLCFLTACEGNKSGSSKSSGSAADGSASDTSKSESDVNSQDIGSVSYVDSPLVDKFLKLVSEISARAPKLNRERDRRGKLRLALGSQLGVGCMQDVKVKSLEVIIEGQKMGDADITPYYRGPANPSEGTGRTVFEFSFGDGTFSKALTFTNEETRNALFSVGTRKSWVPESQDYLVGQIQRIKIKKLSGSFHTKDLCDGGSFVSSCTNKQQIIEQERYYLSSLKVKINGELIYDRGNISHLFSSYGTQQDSYSSLGFGWSDDHININEAYVRMKQRDDCTSFQ